jgi:tricarballylate dehydrogenase
MDWNVIVVGAGNAAMCAAPAARDLVGGLLFHNSPGGSGLAAGAVYGRRAGDAAAGRE